MQTDTWLSQSSHPDQCPLCSKPLKRGSGTCYFCGFSAPSDSGDSPERARPRTVEAPAHVAVWIDPSAGSHALAERGRPGKQPNPATPIPPRASAHPVNVRQRYVPSFITKEENGERAGGPESAQHPSERDSSKSERRSRQPDHTSAASPIIWQHESPTFEASSSLSSLSLVASELPTPPERTPSPRVTQRLQHVDEIDTVPPAKVIDAQAPTLALVPSVTMKPQPAGDAASWTSGGAVTSSLAQRIVDRRPVKRRRSFVFNPFDRLRWWLLYPGRMEFMLWFGGTVLLVGVTCILLLATAVSFGWLNAGLRVGTLLTGNATITPSPGSQAMLSITSTPGLSLVLMDKGTLRPGQTIHLHGSGFRASGWIAFTFDNWAPFLDQQGHPSSIQANAHGEFTVSLLLQVTWTPGQHIVVAREAGTNHLAVASFELASGHPGTRATPTTAPSRPGSGSGSGFPTPVGRTPVPGSPPAGKTPQPGVSPTPTRPVPTPTSTPTVGVTATATAGVTQTPAGSAAPSSPTSNSGSGPSGTTAPSSGSGIGDALVGSSAPAGFDGQASDSLLMAALTRFGSWLVLAGYGLAMLMLGAAGVVHKRRVR